MLDMDIGADALSTVFRMLFSDSMRKIGKKKLIKSMYYNVFDGLVVTDENDVKWKVDVNASVHMPENLEEDRLYDETAKFFCTECDVGLKENKEVCDVCSYLRKA